ncbi:MAG: hypothetical protein AAF126_00420 [Chloroflexota bacterium]
MTDSPIWERLPTDTDKSFQAFCIYRDMGAQRSLSKAYAMYKGATTAQEIRNAKSPDGTFTKWSSEHNWSERVSAYDVYQDGLRQERNLARQKLIEDNAYDDYMVLRKAIAKYVGDYTAMGFNGVKPHDVSNLASLMKQADDYARRAVGLPDRITENNNSHTGPGGGAIEQKVTTHVTHGLDDATQILTELKSLGVLDDFTGNADDPETD